MPEGCRRRARQRARRPDLRAGQPGGGGRRVGEGIPGRARDHASRPRAAAGARGGARTALRPRGGGILRETALAHRVVSGGGALYMVSTPIGHLGDFSFRGVEVLRRAAVIACEDTRHTRRLLTHYEIDRPTTSIHAHTRDATLERLLDRVEAGEEVAYVTDAGTPGISDPGGLLAERAHARGLRVVPIPGPGAVTAALAAAGFPADRFLFLGFLPKKGTGRAALLRGIAEGAITSVCYEAPGRTTALLRELAGLCGAERPAAV